MKKENKIMAVFLLMISVILIGSLFIAIKEDKNLLKEQTEFGVAIQKISENDFEGAKNILKKYKDNPMFQYSPNFNANFALALMETNDNESPDIYIKNAYNTNPYLIFDSYFIEVFDDYIEYDGDNKWKKVK